MARPRNRTVFLRQTQIEILNQQIPRGQFRFVLFDFDGTISLIREGWQQVMIPMMVEALARTPQAEPMPEIQRLVEDYIARSTGVQTVYQMIWLADEVARRRGKALGPLTYKDIYNEMLLARIRQRIEDLQAGRARPEDWMVPGARQLLENLRRRGCTLFCASGTDHEYMTVEAELLGVAGYFDGGLYGAVDDYRNFSKKILIDRIIKDNNLAGSSFLTFGDGFVEIEDTKSVAGVAVGVASDEIRRCGVNPVKRARLIEAGADVIIPDFREQEMLLEWLFPQASAE
jgi:phosphoglycolate phosphatase